jgi:hypothetical protein
MTHLRRRAVQVGWLILIWVLSVGALGAAAWAMRILMRALGMAS